MNEPRTIPHAFRVFAFDGWAWLYDDSTREYPCTATPHVWAEPIYVLDPEEWDGYQDPALFLASMIEGLESFPVDVQHDLDHDERMAWDDARQEACTNRCI